MLNALLQQLFSAHPALNASSNLDFGHYLAVIVVGAGVGVYHWRVLRADAAARPSAGRAQPGVESEPGTTKAAEPAPVVAVAPPVPLAIQGADLGESRSRSYVLSVTDATEDDVHQALATLPPHAAYKLTPTEKGALPVDGH
jgi:hypothetical protein